MKTSPCEPERIDIVAADGRPSAIRVGKRTFKVVRVLNVWRVDEDWWREPVSRLYLSLELDSGARLTVFRDILSGLWYRQNFMGL